MRVKELKNLLERLPEETEIQIRCKVHERPAAGLKDSIEIASVTPDIGETNKVLLFNPKREVRLFSYMPYPDDKVSCLSCAKYHRLEACIKKGRVCENCNANCDCKNCGHFNVEVEDVFAHKPMFEQNPSKKK